MSRYGPNLDKHSNMKTIDYYFSNRKWVAMLRLGIYNSLFRFHFGFWDNFTPFRPGLEVKNACEAAEKVGAEIEFMGPEFDQSTWQRLYHETRMNLPEYLVKRF